MKRLFAAALLGGWLAAGPAAAQSWQMNAQSYALKAGETQQVMQLYWVIACRSQLTGPPEATILEGPPGVTVAVEEGMVNPRFQQCAILP